jgi:hypothetical protein
MFTTCTLKVNNYSNRDKIYKRKVNENKLNYIKYFNTRKCDHNTHKCDYNTRKCDHNTHKCDYNTRKCDY